MEYDLLPEFRGTKELSQNSWLESQWEKKLSRNNSIYK